MTRVAATLLLILLNIFVFVIMAVYQESLLFNRPEDFFFVLFTGANFNPFTVDGDYWRLLTSMFMHWGILHLAVNMYALYSVGRELEVFLGKSRFMLLYFITGIGAGLSSLIFNLYVVSAGASGAIFGLFGYMITWQVLTNFQNRKQLQSILINFVIFLVVNYVIARNVNVDTAAHIGGFVMGTVLSLLNFFGLLIPLSQWIMLSLIIPFMVLLVPKDQLNYYNIFQKVVDTERRLQRVYNQLLTDHQRADSLALILPRWDSVHYQLKNLKHVPPGLANDTTILNHYISLRKAEVNYRLMGVEMETFVYLDSLEITNQKFDSLPKLKYVLNYQLQPTELANVGEDSPPGKWVTVYYDSSWREIQGDAGAHFYRIGMRDTLERWQGDVRDYYINGKIQMKGRYLNNMHNGVFRYYTRDGKYESLGRYDKERAVGKWENFYKNGQLQSEVYYGDQFFTKSVWDSLGNQQVKNGNGKQITWHKNGTIAEEGEFRDGQKQGNWLGYYSSGAPHYQEYYRNGLLVRGVALDENGQRYVYDQLSVFPFPEMGMKLYQEYLQKNLVRPGEARNINGVVKLNFLVDTDGSMRDFIITEGLCTPCDLEAIRLVKEGPKWRPGVLRGHIKILSNGFVEVYY
ncbi:MAG TPA: rhomboid family intramembrane serine protease [Cyclobacteriaceae bacterium]|nr:rhomboid family intramembrane serine protease [Cyclobacteriaceae bacterium]